MNSDDALERANALLDIGRPRDALAALATVAPHESPDADTIRAHCLLALGRHNDALTSASAAIASNPEHLGAHLVRSVVLAELGQRTASLAAAEQAAALAPQDPPVLFTLGMAQLTAGLVNKARDTAESMVAEAPNHSLSHHLLGAVARQQRELGLAEQAYRRSLAIAPTDFDVATSLGEVLADQGRHTESADVLGAVVRADPLGSDRAKSRLAGIGGGSVSLFALFFGFAQLVRAGRYAGYEGVAGAVLGLFVIGMIVDEVQARRRVRHLSDGMRTGVVHVRRDSNIVVACVFSVVLAPLGLWGLLMPHRASSARLTGTGLLVVAAIGPWLAWRKRRRAGGAGIRQSLRNWREHRQRAGSEPGRGVRAWLGEVLATRRRRFSDRRAAHRRETRYVQVDVGRPRTRDRTVLVLARLLVEASVAMFAVSLTAVVLDPAAPWPPQLGLLGWLVVSAVAAGLVCADGWYFDGRARASKNPVRAHRVVLAQTLLPPSARRLAGHALLRLVLGPLDVLYGAVSRRSSRLLHDRLAGTDCVLIRAATIYDAEARTHG